MKRPDRLARSGAFSAAETIKRERPFGLTLLIVIIAVSIVLVLSRSCSGTAVNALVVSPVTGSPSSAGGSDYELLMPFISLTWPPPPVISTCTSEEPTCN